MQNKDDGIVQNTSHTISFLHILLETHLYHIKKKAYSLIITYTFSISVWIVQTFHFL